MGDPKSKIEKTKRNQNTSRQLGKLGKINRIFQNKQNLKDDY